MELIALPRFCHRTQFSFSRLKVLPRTVVALSATLLAPELDITQERVARVMPGRRSRIGHGKSLIRPHPEVPVIAEIF